MSSSDMLFMYRWLSTVPPFVQRWSVARPLCTVKTFQCWVPSRSRQICSGATSTGRSREGGGRLRPVGSLDVLYGVQGLPCLDLP